MLIKTTDVLKCFKFMINKVIQFIMFKYTLCKYNILIFHDLINICCSLILIKFCNYLFNYKYILKLFINVFRYLLDKKKTSIHNFDSISNRLTSIRNVRL